VVEEAEGRVSMGGGRDLDGERGEQEPAGASVSGGETYGHG
jgi:hypothetical protein